MRSLLSLIVFLLPLVRACDNPDNDDCAAAFTKSSSAAASFCKTYTAKTYTATTGLPAFASACSDKPKSLSSACSCLVTGSATTTTTASTTLKTVSSTGKTSSTSSTTTATTSSGKSSSTGKTSTTTGKTTTTTGKTTTTTKTSTTKTSSTKTSSTKTTTTAKTSGSGSAPASCTCTSYSQVAGALSSCNNIELSNIAVPAGSSLDLSKATDGTTITFSGNTSFGFNPSSTFNPVVFGGNNILITGNPGHAINGGGAQYWDGQGSNGGSSKPDHFIVVDKMTNSVIKNLNIYDWPVHCFDVTKCDGVTITNLYMDNSDGDAPNSKSKGLPAAHNSDGFDFSSSNNMLLSNTKVHNQDDCVAVTSGVNVTVTGMYCYGGHGLSIGSVGGKSNNDVEDITFSNSQVINSSNGCRIKTNSGTTGSIKNIVYTGITVSDISAYGIDVQQDYLNGGPTGKPTNGVTINGLTFTDITGTALSSAQDYYILCGSGSCSNFSFNGVKITGGTDDTCNYPPSGCPS